MDPTIYNNYLLTIFFVNSADNTRTKHFQAGQRKRNYCDETKPSDPYIFSPIVPT